VDVRARARARWIVRGECIEYGKVIERRVKQLDARFMSFGCRSADE